MKNKHFKSESVLQQLENWKNSSKSHAVKIDHPNSYGAGCWTVILQGPYRDIRVDAVSFYKYKPEELPDNVVVVSPPDVEEYEDINYPEDEEDFHWPTLEECIVAGLKRYHKLNERKIAGETLKLWDFETNTWWDKAYGF